MRKSSTETKATILSAARERFAADGYDRATIRSIAADAAIDPAMVMRYYGSKERLFAAAAEFDLELPDLTTIDRERVGAELVAHFLERWERDEALLILLRTGLTNEAVAERMRSIFATQLQPVIARFGDDSRAGSVRAAMVASQILGMALCRYVLAFPPLVSMPREQIVDWLAPTIQTYLNIDPGTAEICRA